MVLDPSLLNSQHCKIWMNGKVGKSRERSSALPYTCVLSLLKREPFGHPRLLSPTLLYIYLWVSISTNYCLPVRRHQRSLYITQRLICIQSDIESWTPTHGRAKAGRPARTYIQQLCEDTGCCPEDLPRAMNDREEWRERVRDIRATSAIWWWWWWWTVCKEMSLDLFKISPTNLVNK